MAWDRKRTKYLEPMLATKLRGARTHNLRDVDLDLLPGQAVALTGVSGAGKSSLALDTLYAEGQRRFVESFSPYARQFLERLERPPVKSLEPVPAAIAVDRTVAVKSSRSTVATMADLEAYLAALFLRESVAFCPEHDVAATELDANAAAERALDALDGARAVLTFAIPIDATEQYLEVREGLLADGYHRLWLDGGLRTLDEVQPSRVVKAERVDVVLDRLSATTREKSRWVQAIEQAWKRARGKARVFVAERPDRQLVLRRGFSCPVCSRPLSAPGPGQFSVESPLAACPTCRGFGRVIGIDMQKVVPDPDRALAKGAIRPWSGKSTAWERAELAKLCRRHGISMSRSWRTLSEAERAIITEGDGDWDEGGFPGILGWFSWLETKSYKMHVRVLLSRYRSYDPCPDCEGRRFNDHTLGYRVAGRHVADWHELEIDAALDELRRLTTRTAQGEIARRELTSRLDYLSKVGLGYLTLDRQSRTLSGGETQRVTLTAALGTSLSNALFVLDEPTVGLHAADIQRLQRAVDRLVERRNAVLIVEHDPQMIRAADRVIELGPGAGDAGGQIVFDGTPAQVRRAKTATGRALRVADRELNGSALEASDWLCIEGASEHNLQLDVKIPLGCLCVVTGPSGSGKSSLVNDVVYRALARRLGDFAVPLPGAVRSIDGAKAVKKVVLVDQSPLGRTSRGNAATYTKAWDAVRKAFAAEPLAKMRGYSPSHFSFNVAGGRCEACAGEGFETVEMQFLADVRLTCPVCRGRRFSEEVLQILHRGRSVADLLDTTVDGALELFAHLPMVQRALGPVKHLGLGYLKLGQPLSTLSGGEAQRLKLARSLAEVRPGTLVVVDEPSAGLHGEEVLVVLAALCNIVKSGGSVLVVEHDLSLIRRADWVIDLGPGGGAAGGRVVAQGTPAEVAKTDTKTGVALSSRATTKTRAKRKGRALESIVIEHAREHNLKDVSLGIPHGQFTCVTGPSGSGKSSLAFDVVFAEGQRRFMETLTPYARQFLPMMPRADVDSVAGLPPSVALEQRTSRAGSMSTVATVTEVAHYLRLLFAKAGVAHCPEHGTVINRSSREQLLERCRRWRGAREILAPAVQGRKGSYRELFLAAERAGIGEAYADGQLVETAQPPSLARSREHHIDLIVARLGAKQSLSSELLERTLSWGRGALKVKTARTEQLLALSGACDVCNTSVPELDPRWFSFNTAQGRCPTCLGQGQVSVASTLKRRRRRGRRGKREASPVDPEKEPTRECPDCGGTRLSPVARAVKLNGLNYAEVVGHSVASALRVVDRWRFDASTKSVWEPIVSELKRRLRFLAQVGLDYLTLDRRARTLSGGELQRLRLAAQLGAGLTGALYVLDEPTIGLHAKDTERLIDNLRGLVALGSTVLVVEHDLDVIQAADHVIDLGPSGGRAGGEIVAEGSPKVVLGNPQSPTGRVMAKPPELRRPLAVGKAHPMLELRGAAQHNLKSIDIRVPVGRMTAVVGVSGSGKSTLVSRVLLPAVRQRLKLVADEPGHFESLGGVEGIGRALSVDQSPIGRTPRSVPATFLGIWDAIRRLFAASPEAQVRGFTATRFSFNSSSGGRCPTCEGQAVVTHEMSFLPNVAQRCPTCDGARFEPETLQIRYRGLSIADVLHLTASDAASVFEHHPKIAEPLRTLVDLGAGYVQLGQGSHTLSGGEAQRLKLADELTAGARHLPTLYVLDEPTTGLHLADVSKLMSVLGRLVERGDTLVIIEHHPDILAGADWLVELGPKGGEGGGRVLHCGPRDALTRKRTPTAKTLASRLAVAQRPTSRARASVPPAP